jgi:hypothetical protein
VPQIIVTADRGAAFGEGAVTLRERVTATDCESEHFANQLVERLGWAVGDAHEAERIGEPIATPPEPIDQTPELIDASAELIDAPPEPMTDPAEPLSVPSRA